MAFMYSKQSALEFCNVIEMLSPVIVGYNQLSVKAAPRSGEDVTLSVECTTQ